MNFSSLINSSLAKAAEIAADHFGAGIENGTMAEKVEFGLQVVLIGMGVVFGVLLILIGILQIFKLFAKSESKKTAEKTVAPATAPTSVTPATSVASAPASEEEAIVAIATAAIAASRGESECAFNVISIKKIVK